MGLNRRPIDFLRLRALADARTVLEIIGWRPISRRGENWRGPCPFHGSARGRSISLSARGSVARCFKCGWCGDALAIWAWWKKMSLLDAAYDLCERLNLDPPIRER